VTHILELLLVVAWKRPRSTNPRLAHAREVTAAHGSARDLVDSELEYQDWARLQGRGPHTGGPKDRLVGWRTW
jgi:hypothetical protein